jgi:glutamate N-acetyltransferase / amino-acid N-acetyltransferase
MKGEAVMNKKHVDGGICAPLGFTASGVAADLNGKGHSKKDVALIFSQVPAVAAGVFTLNAVKAAPILVTQEVLKNKTLQAVVINSRNANSCTAEQGMRDAKEMCLLTAHCLGIKKENVAVSSTGVIGVPLPMQRIASGILAASTALSKEANHDAAAAIMTTDTFPKQIAIQIKLGGSIITMGGISKGSGMVHPNMATILGFITTDAKISPDALQAALKKGNEKSFNMISVDGDTSTNDMLLIMANGLSGNPEIQIGTIEFEEFTLALEYVLIFLAKEIARDGEGATKLLEVQIVGAVSEEDAKMAAKAVCSSLLVKTAIFGRDANWGRILCALGYSGAHFDPSNVNLYIGDVQVMQKGVPLMFDEEAALKVLSQNEVVILGDLQSGNASAVSWGCDLSYDYVKINGAYRT